MLSFHSINNLFHLKLPKQWNYEFKDNIYTFFKEDEFNGVIQISAYFNKSKVFELSKEYQKEKEEHPKAKISPLSTYEAIYYSETENNDIVEHYWITGYKSVKLFCTIVMDKEENILKGTKILHSLSIHPI